MKNVGIYKVTSPEGWAYIGQSRNVKKRFKEHRTTGSPCHESMLKYGKDAHKFELIAELPTDVSQEVLDDYEIFYISQYRSAGIELKNFGDGGYRVSSWKGKKMPHDIVRKRADKIIGRNISEEHKALISKANKGKVFSTEHRQRLSIANAERNRSPEQLAKSREGIIRKMKERGTWQNRIDKANKPPNRGLNHHHARFILHTEYGVFFTLKEAAKVQGVSFQQMWSILNGWKGQRNYTKFIYT